MSVARNTEISATSSQSFEDAIKQGLNRATKTLRNVKGAWIKEQEVMLENDQIAVYKVERYLRDAKLTEIGEGTSQIQRLVIGRKVLDLRVQ